MECPEPMLEKLASEVRTLEAQVTHLNVKVGEQCPDSGMQQEFSRIKAELKTLEREIDSLMARSSVATTN